MAAPTNLPASLDASGLPQGLPDQTYATWWAALSRVRNSSTFAEGEKNYEFCSGFVQALHDTQGVDERICRFLRTQLRELWAAVHGDFRLGL
ncbi:hypothetical protein [Pseudomonas syringae group sp. J309-1]|uniref:hypothetical protein n=1 Tax=Pseudomonas syringae group sp. J309-1 TaxID=3079588 RepID=UPI000F06747B|nr:hypothetical protein [Pseudomonas syringae group sp. J309-1]MDU8357268.1 hypothetical protein [Pseudomonas syringae group sp. J309-1]